MVQTISHQGRWDLMANYSYSKPLSPMLRYRSQARLSVLQWRHQQPRDKSTCITILFEVLPHRSNNLGPYDTPQTNHPSALLSRFTKPSSRPFVMVGQKRPRKPIARKDEEMDPEYDEVPKPKRARSSKAKIVVKSVVKESYKSEALQQESMSRKPVPLFVVKSSLESDAEPCPKRARITKMKPVEKVVPKENAITSSATSKRPQGKQRPAKGKP